MGWACVLPLLLLLSVVANGEDASVVVPTEGGLVRGEILNGYRVFKGIPYAEAPIGQRRWTPPVPKAPWKPKVLNATSYGAACMQLGSYGGYNNHMSEDCLYLNVFTPIPSSVQSAPSWPVMVFIYGGGWTQGFGSLPLYWGDFIANTTETILVSINYRLGALGFFSWSSSNANESIPGNFGFMDQQLALRWVQKNIQNFGGNPSEVTLFGQSAGGISVATHLISPASANLFSRAIIQSNPFGIFFRHYDTNQEFSTEFSILLGCFPGDLACLRNKSAEDVLAAQGNTVWIPIPFSAQKVLPWQPVIDGVLIPGQPLKLLIDGKYNKNVKSVILGTVADEMLSFVYGAYHDSIPSWEYQAFIYTLFGLVGGDTVLSLYPAVSDDNKPVLCKVLTDLFFACATRRAAIALTKAGMAGNTYLYYFLHPPVDDPMNNSSYCRGVAACHGADLAYVFHSAEFEGFKFYGGEDALSWSVLGCWTTFAHKSVPLFLHPKHQTTNVTTWPPFDPTLQQSLGLDIHSVVQKEYKKAKCDMWDTMGFY